jgi:hypothetical protein
MGKLTSSQIELIRRFVDTFELQTLKDGEPITFENAIRILEGELPEKKTADERRKDFADTLRPHLLEYGSDMLNKFYRYWARDEGTKIKFETQKTWELKQRLANWKRNDEEYERKKYIEQFTPNVRQYEK